MKTLFVTAGHEWEFPSLAARSAARINDLADRFGSVRAIDISKDVPWSKVKAATFGKAWIWDCVPDDVDRIIWIDCDAIVIRPVHEEMLPECIFGATYDQGLRHNDSVIHTSDRCKFALKESFNAGVMVAHRDARCVFDELKPHVDQKTEPWQWTDQEWFNVLVREKLGGWTDIGAAFNTLVGHGPVEGAHIIHLAGHHYRAPLTIAMYEMIQAVTSLRG